MTMLFGLELSSGLIRLIETSWLGECVYLNIRGALHEAIHMDGATLDGEDG